jgi:hypothetical protein
MKEVHLYLVEEMLDSQTVAEKQIRESDCSHN